MDILEIRKLNPEFTYQVLRGVALYQSGQREQARHVLARAVLADPTNSTAWLWLGRCLDDPRRKQECRERVRQLDQRRCMGRPGGDLRNNPDAAVGHACSVTYQDDPAQRLRRPAGPSLQNVTDQESTRRHAESVTHRVPRPARRVRRRVFLLALIAVALACAATPLLQWQSVQARSRVDSSLAAKALQASGTIRTEEVQVASEYGGRLVAVLVREGQSVEASDVVARLDTSLLDAQIQAAEAGVALAQAGLAQTRAGSRPGQIAVAAAQLAQAEAGRLAAMQAVSDTKALVANPQDIQLQIAVTQAQIQSAEHKLAQALARVDATQIGKDKFEEAQKAIRDIGGPGQHRIRVQIAQGPISQIPPDIRNRLPPVLGDGRYTLGDLEIEIHGGTFTLYRWITVNVDLPFEAHLAPNMWWQAWVGVNAAAARKEGYEAMLGLLSAQRTNPQDLQARADAAVAALAQAEAQVKAAQAQLDALQAGAMPEQIATLEARVQQAQATLDTLTAQRAQMTIAAPIGGTVTSIALHEGEVAAKGTTLLTIANLKQVKLTVYLPEDRIGLISVGQAVQVTVDSFPGRVFAGRVEHIADQAEFMPKNVATQEERVNLVFAVDVRLPNEQGELKPGMPADASFGP